MSVENCIPKSEISLSEEWVTLSEALYGQKFIAELADFFKKYKVKTILECGCGGGHVLQGLGERGFSCLGIDSSKTMINIAKQHNFNSNVEFRKMNWLELDELTSSYDCVMCRGNSLAYAVSWESSQMRYPTEEFRDIIFISLQKMLNKIKDEGLLYVDTVSEKEVSENGRNLAFENKDIKIVGKIKYDFSRKLRYTYGEGVVKGKKFKGGSVSYLLLPNELREMLEKLGARKIFNPNLKNERNYSALYAVK